MNLKKYFLKFCETPLDDSGFYTLKEDLKAFKVLDGVADNKCQEIIANLIIPWGSNVYCTFKEDNAFTKLRACSATVYSMYTKDKQRVVAARSQYDPYFYYVEGETVYPEKFSLDRNQCDEGIHFFLTLEEALNY